VIADEHKTHSIKAKNEIVYEDKKTLKPFNAADCRAPR
jgi:hypothetical protein